MTEGFIERIRAYFDELGIPALNGISYDDFVAESVKMLNRCKELSDAKEVISLFQYCSKKWKKIEKLFSKHLVRWKEYNYEGAANVETLSDDDAQGVYYITNALSKNYKEVYVTSISFDDELYSFACKKGKYILGDDSNYYIKYAKTDACTMKMFDKSDNLICNIFLTKTLDIMLDKNKSKYELVVGEEENDNTYIGVFEKSYIDSLGDNDYIEFKNMVADIEWDLFSSKSDLGIARLTLYKDVGDMDELLYFAASTFLLYKSRVDHERAVASMLITHSNIRMMNRR